MLLPLAWQRSSLPDATLDAFIGRGLRWGLGIGFLAVSLAPGGQPRYTLPLLGPASVLLALVLRHSQVDGALRAPWDDFPPANGTRRSPSTSLHLWLPSVWSRVVLVCVGLAMVGAVAAGASGGPAFVRRWSLVLGLLLAGGATLRWTRRVSDPVSLALASAVGMALLTADFALGAIRPLRRVESVRPVGRAISRAADGGAAVAVLSPGFLPFLFYVPHLRYVQSVEELPLAAPYLLVRQSKLGEASEVLRRRRIDSRIALHARDKRMRDSQLGDWVLLRLSPTAEAGL